ncbi:MAG: hypothetical protein RhofKO_35720 [Rhodothermales bacterium]
MIVAEPHSNLSARRAALRHYLLGALTQQRAGWSEGMALSYAEQKHLERGEPGAYLAQRMLALENRLARARRWGPPLGLALGLLILSRVWRLDGLVTFAEVMVMVGVISISAVALAIWRSMARRLIVYRMFEALNTENELTAAELDRLERRARHHFPYVDTWRVQQALSS